MTGSQVREARPHVGPDDRGDPGRPPRSRMTQTKPAFKEVRIMMPYDIYRLYQAERAKSSAEIQRADMQAARLVCAVASLFRSITRPVRAVRRLGPSAVRGSGSAPQVVGTQPRCERHWLADPPANPRDPNVVRRGRTQTQRRSSCASTARPADSRCSTPRRCSRRARVRAVLHGAGFGRRARGGCPGRGDLGRRALVACLPGRLPLSPA